MVLNGFVIRLSGGRYKVYDAAGRLVSSYKDNWKGKSNAMAYARTHDAKLKKPRKAKIGPNFGGGPRKDQKKGKVGAKGNKWGGWQKRLIQHGIEQKLSDLMAGSDTIEEKAMAAVQANPNWGTDRGHFIHVRLRKGQTALIDCDGERVVEVTV